MSKSDYFECLHNCAAIPTLLCESSVDHVLVYLILAVLLDILPNEWLIKLNLPFCLESHEKMMLPLFSCVFLCPNSLTSPFLIVDNILSGIICHHFTC